MEVAFFAFNDMKTDQGPAVKSDLGAEFSLLLASMLPQGNPVAGTEPEAPVETQTHVPESGSAVAAPIVQTVNAPSFTAGEAFSGEVFESPLPIKTPEKVIDAKAVVSGTNGVSVVEAGPVAMTEASAGEREKKIIAGAIDAVPFEVTPDCVSLKNDTEAAAVDIGHERKSEKEAEIARTGRDNARHARLETVDNSRGKMQPVEPTATRGIIEAGQAQSAPELSTVTGKSMFETQAAFTPAAPMAAAQAATLDAVEPTVTRGIIEAGQAQSAPELSTVTEKTIFEMQAAFIPAAPMAAVQAASSAPVEPIVTREIVEATQAQFAPELSTVAGKRIFELQGAVNWTNAPSVVADMTFKPSEDTVDMEALESIDAAAPVFDELVRSMETVIVDTAKGTSFELNDAGKMEEVVASASFFKRLEGQDAGESAGGETEDEPNVLEAAPQKTENLAASPNFIKHLDVAADDLLAPAAKSSPVAPVVKDAVEAGVRLSVERDGGEVRMKLNPESLGEVRIKLDVSSGTVRAEITVETQEVKAMIDADSAFLKEALASHGLNLDKCVVEVAKPFDAKARFESLWHDAASEERASSGHRKHDDKGSNGWHGRFNQERGRKGEAGVDFFI